jgi:hypothetical protein
MEREFVDHVSSPCGVNRFDDPWKGARRERARGSQPCNGKQESPAADEPELRRRCECIRGPAIQVATDVVAPYPLGLGADPWRHDLRTFSSSLAFGTGPVGEPDQGQKQGRSLGSRESMFPAIPFPRAHRGCFDGRFGNRRKASACEFCDRCWHRACTLFHDHLEAAHRTSRGTLRHGAQRTQMLPGRPDLLPS